ncbi:hypothetical protein BKA83DRAFT_4342523, partial [Pisolithus microcarpus]
YLLNSTDTNNYEPDSMIDYALKTQIGLNAVPRLNGANVKGKVSGVLDWARLVYKLCATPHTDRLQDCTMTSPEKLFLEAVQGMTRETCHRDSGVETTQNMMNTWRKDADELMACLDWNVWVKCWPECGLEVFLPNDALEYTN